MGSCGRKSPPDPAAARHAAQALAVAGWSNCRRQACRNMRFRPFSANGGLFGRSRRICRRRRWGGPGTPDARGSGACPVLMVTPAGSWPAGRRARRQLLAYRPDQGDGAHAVGSSWVVNAALAVGRRYLSSGWSMTFGCRPAASHQRQIGLAVSRRAELVSQDASERRALLAQQDAGGLAIEPVHQFQKARLNFGPGAAAR